MLLPAPPLYPRRHKPRSKPKRTPPPVALMLVSAWYEEAAFVHLTFDRAIDIGALEGSAIVVDDGNVSEHRYAATGAATLTDPTTVRIELLEVEPWLGPDVRLNAAVGNGIVAVDDGGTWAGVTSIVLPFP